MAEILRIDRAWLQDYIDHMKQEIRDIEYICNDLIDAKVIADPSELILYEQAIGDFVKLQEELIIIVEILEQFMEMIDEARQMLNTFVRELRDALNL